tara:strand:- start:8 stop:508 length:501 start_codon:yes stop_codon:yes gene_type:complete
MQVKSFWIIVVKIIGLLFIIDLVKSVFEMLSLFFYQIHEVELIFFVIIITLFAILIYVLLFKPKYIIEKLKLSEGFDEEKFSLEISRKNVLNIIIALTGILILIDSIPDLISQIQQYLTISNYAREDVLSKSKNAIIMTLVKNIIGYLIIANNTKIANFIERKNVS